MKRFLSIILATATLISVIGLSGCNNSAEIIYSDPAQLIDLDDTCITAQESGDYTYHPSEEVIEIDPEDGEIFFNNLITVFLDRSLSSNEVQELLDYVNGELVGITRNGVNSLEIKVEKSSLSELKEKADALYDFDCVLFSDCDFPIAVSNAELSNDPWIAGDTPIDNRGNEDHPDGNDWWAEAVGAYTAWELCENISEKTKVAVVDSGVNFDHEELSGVSGFSLYPNTPSSHGTAVAGIIAAECNNNTGIRGIAGENAEVVSVDIEVDGRDYWSSNEWISIFGSLVEDGNRVINFSQAIHTYSQDYYEEHFYSIEYDNEDWYSKILDEYIEIYFKIHDPTADEIYQAYRRLVETDVRRYGVLCIRLIANLIMNGHTDFIFVQAAGNGYNNSYSDPGCNAFYSGFFDAINKETFYFTASEEILKRLEDNGIDYDNIANHKIVVAATGKPDVDGNYSLPSWSSYGDNVDICAPGEDIYHCPSYGSPSDEEDICCDYQDDVSCCIKIGGTSAAAPIVTSAVALTWAAFPGASAATIKEIIINSATVYATGSTEGDNRTYPVLNIEEAVKEALPERVVLNQQETVEPETETEPEPNNLWVDVPDGFIFTSGVGAWRTKITISDDGTFTGQFTDSDMGLTGPGYSKGSCFISDFNGKFSTPKKINEYTYSVTVENLTLENNPGKEYYMDDVKYICTEPYGFEDAEDFYLYLPGAPISELPEEFLSWTRLNSNISKLPPNYYGLYNPNAQAGFVGQKDNSMAGQQFYYYYGSNKSAFWPSYTMPSSHLVFWFAEGASVIDLCFDWSEDETEFVANDSKGSGEYGITITVADGSETVTIKIESKNGTDLTEWGGTADGILVAEYRME